ncbi:hypothetical protein DRQ07_08765 [candidate division KSB1 bacterium]|nr:MAG: hypothetical protein DRQ07_08765 [candidate division KSB1 bacterium]
MKHKPELIFLKFHLPALIMALVILTLSSIPNLTLPDAGIDFEDKIPHFIEYFIFYMFLLRSASKLFKSVKKRYLYSFLFAVAFAGIDEIHQMFISGRYSELFDFIADTAGSALSMTLMAVFKRYSV